MTSMKRPLEESSQTPASGLSKTERRRLAKKAKKERQGKGKGGDAAAKGGAGAKSKKGPKPKMTKEERRAKYTQKAYEARERQNQLGPGANKTRCLGCRAWGHVVANCPEAKAATGICFNCGSSKHALRVCPEPKQKDGSLPHATCFVCKEKGHISAHCKQNANGVYPKGGFCKGCGSKHHLSWDCPDSTKVDKKKLNKTNCASTAEDADANQDNQSAKVRQTNSDEPLAGGRGGGGGDKITRSDGGAGVATAPGDSKVKRRKRDSSGMPHANGSSKRAAVPRSGGDDLEDDDYYDPEDVPAARFEADGTEDSFEAAAGLVTGRAGGGAAGKKKSKIVVF
eukprot:g10646.t2